MTEDSSQIRVRYAEVDQMGYLHHGRYADYFEVARTESLRKQGISYKEMEEKGFMLPLASLQVDYLKPACYDELVEIHVHLTKMEGVKLFHEYEMLNSQGECLAKAKTTLVFIDAQSRRPCRPPQFFLDALN